MKTTGAQWQAYLDSWPEGQWYDDSDETINGIPCDEWETDIPPDAVVEVTCGVLYPTRDADGVDLVRHFNKWLRAQSWTVVFCEVPKDKVADLKSAVKKLGGKTKEATND